MWGGRERGSADRVEKYACVYVRRCMLYGSVWLLDCVFGGWGGGGVGGYVRVHVCVKICECVLGDNVFVRDMLKKK